MNQIDLHAHTTASDGTTPPRELVQLAHKLGLIAVAVTDHDTMAGTREAVEEGARLGVRVIPGIEFNTQYRPDMEESVHLLGYGMDEDHPEMEKAMAYGVQERRTRNREIARLMRADGIPVSLEELEAEHPGTVIGRPHFAQVLIRAGVVSSTGEAFVDYLGSGQKYYVPRGHLPLPQAVQAIRSSGGVAVLAHPLQYGFDGPGLEQLVRTAAQAGAEGIEVYYSGYDEADRERLLILAHRYGLFFTGGSDYHGTRKPRIGLGSGYGELNVPEEALTNLTLHMDRAREGLVRG